MAYSEVEIVDTVEKCDRALQELRVEDYLAVDGKGVNLKKTGPFTLLQIGTKDGQVYLFDVLTEPRILKTGGLKAILESDTIVKVMHSSTTIAEALYWQFGVQLHNVFDTQLAHMELQRAEGRRFPRRMKRVKVCGLYCPQKVQLLEDTMDLGMNWSKREGELWAKRPMTPEMIYCASQDVLVLIPEVYMTIKELVDEKGLTRQVTARISQQMESAMDRDVKDRLKEAVEALVLEILQNFARTTRTPDSLSDITDEDVLKAIRWLRWDHLEKEGLPPNIRDLKVQSLTGQVEGIRKELDEKGDSIVPNTAMCRLIHISIHQAGDDALKQLAIGIGRRLDKILLKDMEKKYNMQTPIQHVRIFEKHFLCKRLHPRGEHDPTVTPVVLRLYWLQQEDSLDYNMQRFSDNPPAFQINPGYENKLRYFLGGRDAPTRLQTKAQNFLRDLEAAGLVVRPPRRRNCNYDDE